MQANIRIRQAIAADIPILRELIEASVRGLQAQDYTPTQLESALKTVYGVDSQLIADGTYFVAEAEAGEVEPQTAKREGVIVGCGGGGQTKKRPWRAPGQERKKGRQWTRPESRQKCRRFFLSPPRRAAARHRHV